MLTKRKDGRFCKSVTINGKKKYFYSSELTERKAEKDIEKQMLEYSEIIKNEKHYFYTVTDEWEELKYPQIQHTTKMRYISIVRKIKNFYGNIPVSNIETSDIVSFLNELVLQKYSTKSIKDEYAVLRMIFNYCEMKKYIFENPIKFISPPKGKTRKDREPLTDEQIKIIENNKDSEMGFFAFFILYSGLRKGEALALTDEDIDFNNKIINVNKSIEHIDNEPHVKPPKTEAGKRIVPLVDKLYYELKKRKIKGVLFSDNGEYMKKSHYERKWKKFQTETGLNITAYNLRHTFTTLLFEWDIDVKDTQTIIGHSDISTTRNIYTHIRNKHFSDTLNRINRNIEQTM